MLRRTLLFSLAMSAACSFGSSAFPPPVVPRFPTASDSPDTGAVVTDEEAELTYRTIERNEKPALVAVLTHWRRIKILDRRGLDAARIELEEDAYSKLSGIEARSVSPGGGVHWMSKSAIGVAPALPELTKQSPLRRVRFTIPKAEVGGLVEFRYERTYADVAFVPTWVYGSQLPTLRSQFAVVAPRGVQIDFRQGLGARLVDEAPLRRDLGHGSERLAFVQRDLPAYYREPHMPSLGRVAPWVIVVVTDYEIGGKRHQMRTWDDVGAYLETMLDAVGGQGRSDDADEVYRDVRDALSPIALDGVGLLKPQPAAELLRGAPACTRDAVAVLSRALLGSDAKSYPAYLTSEAGPTLVEGLPGLYPFVRAAVAVDVSATVAADPSCREDPISRGLLCSVPADSYAFLDPLCKACRFGELPTEYTGGRALVVVDGTARWVSVPADPPERNRVLAQYKLRLDVDGRVKGAMSVDLTGAPARDARQKLRAASVGEPRDRALGELLLGKRTPVHLAKPSYVSLEQVDDPLGVRAQVDTHLEEIAYERYSLRVVDIVGPVLPGRWRSVRRYPAVLEAPAWMETGASVVLPPGYNVDARAMVKIVEPFAEYAAGFERSGRTLYFSRRLVIKQQVIPLSSWPAFRNFLDRIEAFETQGNSVWLNQGLP